MSTNSLEALLAWMKDTSRLFGWGMIVALERNKANLLMRQEYIRRFDSGSYLPPIRGEVPIIENRWMEFINDFVMDVPLLSFENADLNNSKAMLTMSVIGGSQLTLKKESVGWKAEKVDEIDPLQGPKLYLDLLLSQVGGQVDVDGRVILDLKKSDNFRLTFGQTPHEQRLGGDFFKDLFNQLPDDQRIWPLGRIERGTSESMRPQSFALRTQASGAAARDPGSSEHGNGAILALVRMEGSEEGDPLGPSFKYLIPDDADKDYSATVLFDWMRLSPLLGWQQKLINAVKRLFTTDDLEYVYNGSQLQSVVVRSGDMVVGGASEYELGVSYEGEIVPVIVRRGTSLVPASGDHPFTLIFGPRGASMHWRSESVDNLKMYYVIAEEEVGPVDLGVKFLYSLDAEFALTDVAGIGGVVETVMKPIVFNVFITRAPEDPARQSNSASGPEKGIEDIIFGLVIRLIIEWAEGVHRLIGIALLQIMLHLQINFRVAIKPLINSIIKMNFGMQLEHVQIRSPYDIGFFGRVDPTQTSFVISPIQPLMPQDDTQQFVTTPVISRVRWNVENLAEDASDPGSISTDGLYRSPPASSIEGRFKRVRITATDPASGFRSSALVTVLINELSVHPLIQICDVGSSVELAAGALGGGELIWSIKNPVANESGEVLPSDKPEGDHTYHHGPEVANKTYIVDEVEVKNTRTNQTRSVHVLALQGTPGATVKIVSTDIAQGTVQLQAIVNTNVMPDAEWSLPLGGPGSIDSMGLYRMAPTATERFVLIFAVVDGGPFGKFEGHLILPLPLVELPQLLQVPSP
ncbi:MULTISPECIES: hypothetical protein [unclassified Pseudomonas]|uniref:hypothetical protein n=1 Tax=unclassified Pseudomonas TaxID=196821 RepID=UPI0039B72C2A